MFSRRYLLVVILTYLCSSAFTRDTEGNVTLSKVEVLNTSDTSLAVGLNTTVSLWIQFKLNTHSCNSPLVQWCGVVVQKCDTGELSNITDVYVSNLTITTAPKDYGEYRVLVCGKELDQTFAIDYSGPVCRNNGTLPDANYITPPLAVYGVGRNVTLVCVFHGDIQEEDFHVCWNNSDTCLQPGARYHIDHSTALNCTSTGEIVIVNVTFNDSATYTCYAESRSIHYPHGGYQSTNLSILGLPEFIDSPRHIEGTTGNLVEFSWIIRSNEDYIKPFVLVNGTTNLSNITLDYDLKCVTHYPRTEFVDVTLVLDPPSTSTDLKPGTHEIQLCVPFTADVVGASDYNQNPKCSDKTKFTLTIADGHQLMIITFACVIIFILIVCSVAIIAICVFVAIRHRQDSTEQEKLLKGSNSVMRYNTQRDTTTVVNPDGSSLPSVSSDAGVYMNKPGGTVEEESSSKTQSCSRRNKKVFVVYYSSKNATDIEDLCTILSLPSESPVHCQVHCYCDVNHKLEIGTNWNTWTEQQIQAADVVLLVCSPPLHNCLTHPRGSCTIITATGDVSGTAIANLCSINNQCSYKFTPIFLNQPIDRTLIPLSLAGQKAYQVNITGLTALNEKLNKKNFQAEVQQYLQDNQNTEARGLIELMEFLRSN